MTTLPIILLTGAYAIAFALAVYLTRATSRRVAGALAGAATAALMSMGMITLCEALGWWRVPLASTSFSMLLLYAGLAISLSPIYLITWRIARRFGRRGLAVCVGAVAIIGPPRDSLIAAKYPQWMVFSPGVAPILADAATYVGIIVLGHGVMRLVAGPARGDRFARSTNV
jgi:hypothetical protein